MVATPFELLLGWLRARLEGESLAFIEGKVQAAAEQSALPGFFLAFSTVSRRLGRADLALSAADLARAGEARAGWQPGGWNVAQAARALLLLALPAPDPAAYRGTIDQLCE